MKKSAYAALQDRIHSIHAEVRSAGREALKRAVDAQNETEATWSLKHLCAVIKRESGGWRLTTRELSAISPVIYDIRPGIYQVFAWWDISWGKQGRTAIAIPVSGARAFYTGPLAEYWHVTLAGDSVAEEQL